MELSSEVVVDGVLHRNDVRLPAKENLEFETLEIPSPKPCNTDAKPCKSFRPVRKRYIGRGRMPALTDGAVNDFLITPFSNP